MIEFENELFRPMCILVSFRPWGFTTGCNFMGTKVRKICLAHNEKKRSALSPITFMLVYLDKTIHGALEKEKKKTEALHIKTRFMDLDH